VRGLGGVCGSEKVRGRKREWRGRKKAAFAVVVVVCVGVGWGKKRTVRGSVSEMVRELELELQQEPLL
jgi:hypothetical protein